MNRPVIESKKMTVGDAFDAVGVQLRLLAAELVAHDPHLADEVGGVDCPDRAVLDQDGRPELVLFVPVDEAENQSPAQRASNIVVHLEHCEARLQARAEELRVAVRDARVAPAADVDSEADTDKLPRDTTEDLDVPASEVEVRDSDDADAWETEAEDCEELAEVCSEACGQLHALELPGTEP